MATARINGMELYYEVRGEGPPLLLIAGLISDSQSWQSIPGELARRRRVIAFDHRGVGRTTPLDVEISVPALADDCLALIGHLGLSSVDLLGHSLGGFVAQDFALRYPRCVNRMILEGTAARNSARNNALFSDWADSLEAGMDLDAWYRNIFYWTQPRRLFENPEALAEAIRLAAEYPYPPTPIGFRNQLKAIADFNFADWLSRITARTLVVAGSEDLIFPPGDPAGPERSIPNAAYRLIDPAAHAIHTDNPSAFISCVEEFLNRR